MALGSRRALVRGAVGAAVVVLAALLALAPGSPAAVLADDLAQLAAAASAAGLSARAARRTQGRAATAWRWMAAATALWGLGQAQWTWGHLSGWGTAGASSPVYLAYYAAGPLATVALAMLAHVDDVRRSWRARLDVALTASSVVLVVWVLVLGQVARDMVERSDPGPAVWTAVVGSAGQGLMLAAALLALTRAATRGQVALAGSVALLALSGLLHAILVASGLYKAASPPSLAWTLAFLGIALAAADARRPWAVRMRPAGVAVGLATQSLPLVVAWAMLAVQRVDGHRFGTAEFALATVVVALLVVRIGLTVRVLERREAELSVLASRDPLTGLPNRRGLWEEGAARLAAEPGRWALALVDLAGLREVNDRLGVAGGDAVVRAAAARLARVLPPDALLARPAADFAVLFRAGGPDGAHAVALRLLRTVAGTFEVDGSSVPMTTDVGYAVDGTGDIDRLYRHAGLALAAAKRSGPQHARCYDATMHAELVARHELATRLSAAIDTELVVYFQPVVDLATGRVVGAEALVRWDDPERGLLGPGAFIPVAEETGLVVALGRRVLAETCRAVRGWERRALLDAGFRVAVNLSSRQFDEPDLPDTVLRIVADAGLEPGRLGLEITESMAVEARTVQPVLHRLRAAGFAVALDDFGMGYSSLSYLRRLDIDIIKIDRAFVSELGTQTPGSSAVPQAVVDVARGLGLGLVAEGVETPAQARLLREMGCGRAQGFLYAPAVPPDAFADILATQALHGALWEGVPAAAPGAGRPARAGAPVPPAPRPAPPGTPDPGGAG